MIDLHSHTNQSDGTFSPSELVEEACRIGLEALAITDHDSFLGYDKAVPFAAQAGLELICGIEISTKYNGSSVHLLAYFPGQAPTAGFREWLELLLEGRRDRNRRLIEKLQSLGINITLAEVEGKGRTLTARPHFAAVLVEKGYAGDIQDAFDQYLDESGKGYVQRQEVPIEEGIQRVLSAGGVPTLAHPVRIYKGDRERLEGCVSDLAGMGLKAIEVLHSDHSEENAAFYRGLALRFGLGMTGGSDFHGLNKPLISLGTGLRNNLSVPYSMLDDLKSLAKQ